MSLLSVVPVFCCKATCGKRPTKECFLKNKNRNQQNKNNLVNTKSSLPNPEKHLEAIYLGYTVFTCHKCKSFCCVFFTTNLSASLTREVRFIFT